MNEELKVYTYYLINKPIIDMLKTRCLIESTNMMNPLNDDSTVCLYAYTNKKKIAKEFEKTREMNIFAKRVQEMTDDEYEAFDEHGCQISKLEMCEVFYPFAQSISNYTDHQVRLELALTSSESWYCIDHYKESINEFLTTIPKVPDLGIFRGDIKHLLIDMDYADSVLLSQTDYINTHEFNLSPVAKYSCFYAWENPVGILACLYQGIFNNSGLFEVIKNAY